MPASVDVRLPGGWWLDGECHRRAQLRPLTGEDMTWLSELDQPSPAARTTALLARSLVGLGPLERVSHDVVRALTVGDREALLLQLRRATFGERMPCVATCPATECSQLVDLDVTIGRLLAEPYAEVKERHETAGRHKGNAWRAWFRLPRGADQEEAADLARTDPRAAAAVVLARCVEELRWAGPGGPAPGRLPATLARAVSRKMAQLDPQAETMLAVSCPWCGVGFRVLLEAGDYLARECVDHAGDLCREVHVLALHYHWGEAEILAMTPARRQRYLGLLADVTSAGAGA